MSFFTGKKLLLIGFLAVLLAVIPLTVFFLQTRTGTTIDATPATTLNFALPGQTAEVKTLQKNIDDQFELDIIINPGTNQVLVSTLFITYDATKLQLVTGEDKGLRERLATSTTQTEGFTSKLAGPTYTDGTATITLTVGTDVTKVIKTTQRIATIYFKAIGASAETKISFDESKTNVTPSDTDPEINVLSTTTPVSVAIAQAAVAPTVTLVPTLPGSGNVGIGTSVPGSAGQIPICTGLNVDRTTSGAAPFSITFTANGNDPDGTITKATFDFGDGPGQDVTTGGGLGTKTVGVQIAHTYNNPGTFKAKAIFTDNSNKLSAVTDTCSQTLTITQGAGAGGTASTPTPVVVTATPVQEFSTPTPTMKPGPGDAVLGVGIVGIILAILGGFIFKLAL